MAVTQLTEEIVLTALSTVKDPELHRGMMELKMIQDVILVDPRTVAMRVVLTTPACPLKNRIHDDIEADKPAIWRGPMLSGAVRQFLFDVNWGELDYLVVDLPPGTGDVQLTMSQSIPMTGAVVVSTPQDVSTADVARAIQMFNTLKVPNLGLVENMSFFVCPHCGQREDIFGHGGAKALAERMKIPFLGEIPLDRRIREGGGPGVPLMVSEPDSPLASVYREVASQLAAQVSIRNFKQASVIPLRTIYI